MSFHVGQKVVCLYGKRIGGRGTEIMPVKNEVYTVRGIDLRRDDGPGVWLSEIRNKPESYFELGRSVLEECSFSVRRFRPVIERKTDIAIFTALLNHKHLVDA